MKRQKQIDESKEMITRAFVELLRNNAYEDITLTQIADHAGVTRMTLYRHFRTKEMIVLYKAQQSLEEQEHQIGNERQTTRDFILLRLNWLRNLPNLHVLLGNHRVEELLDNLQVATFRARFEQVMGRRFGDDPYLFHFYFGGVNRVVKEWLANGCREQASEVTDRIVTLTRAFAAAACSV